jgi:hypothetical protein
LDQGTPAPLRNHLFAHDVVTSFELGWGELENGDLLLRAETTGFQILVTTDQNLKYQQNLVDRRIAIVVIMTTSWPRIRKAIATVVHAIETATAGGYVEVPIPSIS